MNNRRDVVYFGVDEYDDPLLTYYDCVRGNCTEIYEMKYTRTCDAKEFDFTRANFALLQVVLKVIEENFVILTFLERKSCNVTMRKNFVSN